MTDNQVKEYVQKQATSEMFAARPPSKGATVARHPDSRLMVDLVDYSRKNEKTNRGNTYLMLAINPLVPEALRGTPE